MPLNNGLAAAGEPGQIADRTAVRASFGAVWVRWNVLRADAAPASPSLAATEGPRDLRLPPPPVAEDLLAGLGEKRVVGHVLEVAETE